MPPIYNAGEIFEMALEIERNGAGFYSRAARQADNADVKKLLEDLAEMEKDHEALFARLRDALPKEAAPQVPYDPDDAVAGYLQAAADTHVFRVSKDSPEALSSLGDARDVLRQAIRFEKDTVAFFLGAVEMVPEDLGRAEVEALLREEMAHITLLARHLGELG